MSKVIEGILLIPVVVAVVGIAIVEIIHILQICEISALSEMSFDAGQTMSAIRQSVISSKAKGGLWTNIRMCVISR